MNPKNCSKACAWSIAVLLASYVGCVEIPSEGQPLPDFKAEVRIFYLDPMANPATVSISPIPVAPSTTVSFEDLPSGAFGDATAYMVLPAGDKFLMLKGFDPDTSVLSLAADQHGSLLVLPRPDVTFDRFRYINERYSFVVTGISDTSRVRFVNTIARRSSDTTDVSVDVKRRATVDTTIVETTVVSNLAFGGVSSFVRVPGGETVDFYMTRAGASVSIGDTLTITGASNRDFTIVAYDTIDATSGKVRFTSFQDN